MCGLLGPSGLDEAASSRTNRRQSRRLTGRSTRVAPFHVASPPDSRPSKESAEKMGLLDGKAAIVRGSAGGIGRATAELFAAEGAKVLINDLDADVAEQAAGEIDGETAVHAGDLTKPDAADELVAAGVEAFGALD